MSIHFLLSIIILCGIFPPVLGQEGKGSLEFVHSHYDFGLVSEADGPLVHEFRLVNGTSLPVKVLGVEAACGCTAPEWEQDTIPPGGESYVRAYYDPKNRPGPFEKVLKVKTDHHDFKEIMLYIKGEVMPEIGPVEEEWPEVRGQLRFSHRIWNMGKVYTTDTPAAKDFSIYNAGSDTLRFLDSVYAPGHICVEILPGQLAPGQQGVVRLHYDAKAKGDYGFMNENIILYTDELEENTKSITLYSTIEKYFPTTDAAALVRAPRLTWDRRQFDFGNVEQGGTVEATVTLSNVGRSELSFLKVLPNCSCIRHHIERTSLRPGESTVLKIWFDTEGRRGNQHKSVMIYTDDPREPVRKWSIKGRITLPSH